MKKILIVEDDVDMAIILQIALAEKYELKIVYETKNLPEALENFTPDMLLIDNSVGLAKAPEILRDIELIKKEIFPFILFSAHPDIENIAFQLNANAFLAKPFKLAQLHACLKKVFID